MTSAGARATLGRVVPVGGFARIVRGAALLVACACLAGGCSRIVVLHDPLSAAEHNDLGVAYESARQPDLAAREFRKALRRDPSFSRARINLGNVLARLGRWSDAERCYRRALRDAPDDPDALNNLAFVLLKQRKELDEAHALAVRAVRIGGARDSIYCETLAEIAAVR